MSSIPNEFPPITVNENQLGCSNSSIVKIVALVSGLLLVGSAVTCHIFQVNAIAVYTTGSFGGFFVTVAIASIFQWCRSNSHKETNQSDKTTDQIKAGLDKQAINDLNPLLHEAASLGNAESVDSLLQKGANPRAQNTYGYSAIHLAIFCQDNQKGLNVMRILLAKDPSLANVKCGDGATPLHLVASKSSVQNEDVHKQKVDLLIQNGADVNAVDLRGYTPLYSSLCSVFREHDPSLVVIKALTTSQTKAKKPKGEMSLTPLQAVQNFHPDWCETHQEELSQLLG